jgi:pyruvate kinase
MDSDELYNRLEALIADVRREGDAQAKAWRGRIERRAFAASAANLAHYLAVRRRDLRPLQRPLMALGLSSLGRLESRVAPTLLAVQAALSALRGGEERRAGPSASEFFSGERRLRSNARDVFGTTGASRPVALLITCPSEAADDPAFMLELARREVEAVRINCAHDDADAWSRMIGSLRAAEAETGRRVKVFMDLAGPKIRTGEIRRPADRKRVRAGERLALARPGRVDEVAEADFAVECTLPEALDAARVGHRVFVDDGKLTAMVDRVMPWGVTARVTAATARGYKLKPEKGLNFPDSDLQIDALTDRDRADLAFVATHADAIEFSFVQSAEDVAMLQAALAEHRPDDWRQMGLVLKIETARAVRSLPEILVAAAGRQPTAVMIARGDLAVEIGFARTAEMQEELLWLAEAAHTPVIWATQVLESLVAEGASSRGEMTDAAMAARAECVMLNKGPYLLQAIDQLHALFERMERNQHKKTPQLRRLMSWRRRRAEPVA